MVLKRIAAICFAIAFLMAIVMFTGVGSDLISRSVAKLIFLIVGACGLLLNLFSFRLGKHRAEFNFFYWLGSLVLFTGLIFMIMHWPYGFLIVLAGMATVGVSFFYNPGIEESKEREDLLDN
ncbi:MAG: hypothetical protein ACK46O_06915 [Flavobacteriia bacterium]|jgi:hypothetical protein